MIGAALAALGDGVRALGPNVGQAVSCYVRAGSGSPTAWSYFLLPFGTPATPVPSPIWFTGAAEGVALSTAHGTVSATIDPTGLAAGTVRVRIRIDLSTAPANVSAPRLQVVISTEGGISAGTGPAPARRTVAVVDLGAATAAGLAAVTEVTVVLPQSDFRTSKATVTTSVTPRAGQNTAPLRAAVLDGPVTTVQPFFGTTVGAGSLPGGLSGALGGLLGGTVTSTNLSVLTRYGPIYTVDSDGPVSGTRVVLAASPAVAATPLTWSADVEVPWGPALRPALAATNPGGSIRVRYSASVVRSDASESVPGAQSPAVEVGGGGQVSVTVPAAPAGASFASWRVYRSRLSGGVWSTPVPVGDHPASASFTDTVPASDPATAQPPMPTTLVLTWHGPTNPDPLIVDAKVDVIDAELDQLAPPPRPTTSVAALVRLPKDATLDLRPGRTAADPLAVTWSASATTDLDVRFRTPRTPLDVRVRTAALPSSIDAGLTLELAGLAHARWSASGPVNLTGSAVVPVDGGTIEVPAFDVVFPAVFSLGARVADVGDATDVRVGWIAGANTGPSTVRIIERPAAAPATITDARVVALGTRLGIHLTLPDEGVAHPALLAQVGDWTNPPAAGAAPMAPPDVSGDAPATKAIHIVRRPLPATTPPVPVWNDGDGLDIDVRVSPNGLDVLDIRAGEISSVLVDKTAGEILDLHLAAVTGGGAANIRFESSEPPNTPMLLELHSTRFPTHVDADLVLDIATLATVTWNASESARVTGSASLPDDQGGRVDLPVLDLQVPKSFSVGLRSVPDPAPAPAAVVSDTIVGWCSDIAIGPLVVRSVEHAPNETPNLTDVHIASAPTRFALQLRLPTPTASNPPLLVDLGDWTNAPSPGALPSEVPDVGGGGVPWNGLRLRRRPRPGPVSDPASQPPLPLVGRGPNVAVDIRSADGDLELLDVRVGEVRRFTVDKRAGAATDVHATGTLARTAARFQLHTRDADDGNTTVHARARSIGPSIDLRIRGNDDNHLDVDLSKEASGVEDLRLFVESGGEVGDLATPVASHRAGADDPVSSIIGRVDRVPPGATSIGLHPAGGGDHAPLRIDAAMGTADEPPRARLQLSVQQVHTADAPPTHIDVDAVLPFGLRGVLQGDAGTLGPDSGTAGAAGTVLHDPDGTFEPGWVGRHVEWADGSGTVAAWVDMTHLEIAHDPAVTGPRPRQAATVDWYRIVDRPGDDTGLRVIPATPVRARIAASTVPGWGLVGVNGTPQLRIETQPDNVPGPPSPAPGRGAVAALSVRAAGFARAAQSSWAGEGEVARLLGPLTSTPQPAVLAEQDARSWLAADVLLGARPNRALLVVLHQPSLRPMANVLGAGYTLGAQLRQDFGRNALSLRLLETPDALHLRKGPGVLELNTGAAVGEAFMHAESALWVKGAPFAEVGMGSTHIKALPTHVIMASGSAMPTLGGGVDTGTPQQFGTVGATSLKTDAQRIVAEGGKLELGRMRSVAWDGPRTGLDPWDPGNVVAWSLSDVWFLTLEPTGGGPGELILFTPGEPRGVEPPEVESGLQVSATAAKVTARIMKVSLGERSVATGRRAALEAGAWPTKLKAEIQLQEVEGSFAVKMKDLSLVPDWYQDDQITGGWWWMCAYGAILGIENAQFGSSFGTIDLRDAPWDPYWA